MVLLLGFVIFTFQLGLNFAYGNYVHYATFMSARAYLSGGIDEQDQESRAKEVIVRMLKRSAGQTGVERFPSIARAGEGGDPPGFELRNVPNGDRDLSWERGVRYTFQSRLFPLTLGGSGRGPASANVLTLTSESWLGREPTFSACQGEMRKRKGVFDNGC